MSRIVALLIVAAVAVVIGYAIVQAWGQLGSQIGNAFGIGR